MYPLHKYVTRNISDYTLRKHVITLQVFLMTFLFYIHITDIHL